MNPTEPYLEADSLPDDAPLAPARQAGSGRRRWLRRLGFAGLIALLAVILLLGGGFLVARHVLLPDLDRWRPKIEAFLSHEVGLPVQISGLTGEFEGFSPSIRAESLRVGIQHAQPELLASDLRAVLSWRTILNGKPDFEILQVNKLSARITRISDRRLIVAGVEVRLPEIAPISPDAQPEAWQLPDWLMRQQSVTMPAIDLRYVDRETGAQAHADGLQFRSDGNATERKIRLSIPAVEGLLGGGDFNAKLTRPASANPARVARWQGDAYTEINDVDLPGLTELFRLPAVLTQGMAKTMAWFTVVNSKPSEARLFVEGRDWQVNPDLPEEMLSSVKVEIGADWRRNGNVDLTVKGAQAIDQTGASIELDDKVQFLTLRPDLSPVRARFSLRAFDARRLLVMAQTLPLPPDARARLEKLAMSGRVDRIDVEFDARGGSFRYRIDAEFTDLDLAFGPERELKQALQRFDPRPPWFERLTGSVEMTETGGAIRVFSGDSAFGLPGIFAEPRVPLDQLEADIKWTIDPVMSDGELRFGRNDPGLSGLTVQIDRLQFQNQDAAADVSGTWRGAGKSRRGTIDLRAGISRAQIKRVYRYVPTEIPADVRKWFRDAIVGGVSDDISFRLQGDLADFPFIDGFPGQMLIEAKIRDGVLKYLPEFPPVTDFQGHVRIDKLAMQASAHSGQIFSSKVSDLEVGIADFRHAILKLEGKATGPAQEAIRYVNSSPVTELIDGFLSKAKATGQAVTRLSLDIPLKTPDDGLILGRTTLKGSDVFLTDFLPDFSAVKGELVYGTKGFFADKLQLRMLGGNASVSATTPEKGRLELAVNGRVSAEGLRREVDIPITRQLDGATNYRAAIAIAQPGVSMNIDSDLTGMAVGLPEPLRKAAASSQAFALSLRPVRLAGRAPARWGDRMAIKVGRDFIAMFERDPDPVPGDRKRLSVRRGVIAYDSIPAMPDEGLSLTLNTLNLNVDRWLEALEILPAPGAEIVHTDSSGAVPQEGYFRGFDLEPSRANIVSAATIYNSKRFTDVVLGASRTGKSWAANITTNQVNGYFDWIGPDGQGGLQPRLVGKFQRLEIPDTRTTEFDGLLDTSPTSLPGLDIEAENFILGDKALGRLELQASNRAGNQGWEITKLLLDHPAGHLDATGLWVRSSEAQQQSDLSFDLVLHDAGSLLTVLGQPDTMRNGTGNLSGRIGWRGAPASIDIPSLHGELTLALGPGQFLKTEPGLAKLVGVLSLQSIPRRLTLDFSDVFSAGFGFDTMVGQATVANGTLTTDNLLMNGVQAQVLIEGQADLFAETQSLKVQILPTINAGLASIAYAALANPAVGIGTLIAQILLQDPLRQLFRYEFEVEGSWAEPKVTQTRPVDSADPMDEIYGPH